MKKNLKKELKTLKDKFKLKKIIKKEKLLNDILTKYVNLYSKNNTNITFMQFSKILKISRTTLQKIVKDFPTLDKMAREKFPELFKDVPVVNLIKKDIKAELSKYKTFVITTAVTGCEPDAEALKSVKNYCKINKAKLLIMICSDPAHITAKKGGYGVISKLFKDETIIVEDTKLNSNFFLSSIKVSPKQRLPLTGLKGIGQKKGSFVFAAPRQDLAIEPTCNTKLPRAIMTPGAITLPNYRTTRYMSERTSYLAENDHKMGALVVEIQDNQIFYFTQVQFDKKGQFIDRGIMYSSNNTKKVNPEAIVPGDYHTKEVNTKVKEVIISLLKKYTPKYIVLHDIFSGVSVNHHNEHNRIKKAQLYKAGSLCLEQELREVNQALNDFSNLVKKEVIIVKSNHDEFLYRYLSENKFDKDPFNYQISVKLLADSLKGLDPLKSGIESFGLKKPDRVKFLKRDDDFKIQGIQLAAHGDKGINGARGTLNSMERAYGKAITAHSHTPGILKEAWAVGTSTELRLDYNVGPSSWLHSLALVYDNGMRQLLTIIDGKYSIKK